MARKFKSMDGNNAAAYVSYAFTEVAGIYPITPSSPMADLVDQWAAAGQKNIFGTTVKVVEMQSEAGASGTVHGSLAAGAMTTTYTGLSGPAADDPQHVQDRRRAAALRVPCVRPYRSHPRPEHLRRSLRRHGLPSDRLRHAVRDEPPGGHGPVPVAHLAAIEGRVPFINFFDGFRPPRDPEDPAKKTKKSEHLLPASVSPATPLRGALPDVGGGKYMGQGQRGSWHQLT